jgi:hypothetical protein
MTCFRSSPGRFSVDANHEIVLVSCMRADCRAHGDNGCAQQLVQAHLPAS